MTVLSLLHLGEKQCRKNEQFDQTFSFLSRDTGEMQNMWLVYHTTTPRPPSPSLTISSPTPQKVSYQVDLGQITAVTGRNWTPVIKKLAPSWGWGRTSLRMVGLLLEISFKSREAGEGGRQGRTKNDKYLSPAERSLESRAVRLKTKQAREY